MSASVAPTSGPALVRDARSERLAAAMLIGSMIVFTACVLFGASGGPRGSDQYWYLADTEALLAGHDPTSNCLFPRQLLVHGLERSPFIHDILPQHAVMPFARLFGAYGGWIALNLAAMLLGAWLTFLAARCFAGPPAAATAAALLLLLPVPLFGATQVLVEASMVPLLAAALWLLGRPGGWLKYALLALVLTLALMSRVTMIAFAALLPVAALAEPTTARRRVLLAGWSVLLLAVGAVANRLLFGGIPLPGDPIALAVVGNGMDIWLTTEPVVLSPASVQAKLLLFLRTLGEGTAATRIFTLTNALLMLAAAIGAVVAWRRGDRRFALAVAAVLGVNLATLALYQNQPRFVLPTYPVLAAAAVLLVDARSETGRRAARRALPAAVALLAALAIAAAWAARSEGLRDRTAQQELEAFAASLAGSGDLIHADGNDQLLGYAFRPRTVLFTAPDQAEQDWRRLLAMPRWRWITVPDAALPRLRALGVDAEVTATIERRGSTLRLLDRGAGATP